MANLWDDLSPEERRAVAKQGMVGSEQSNANLSRMMEQLSNNPKLVERLASEAGIVESDGDLDDTQPDEDQDQDNEGDIERTVNEAIDDPNVQETGEVAQDIPPPVRGESIEQYAQRLMAEMGNEEAGFDTVNDTYGDGVTVVRKGQADYERAKGLGKVHFDPAVDKELNARTAAAVAAKRGQRNNR